MPSYDFLKQIGLFFEAKDLESLTLAEFEKKCDELEQKGDLAKAVLYAQKASINHGLNGLMLFFDKKTKWIIKEHQAYELVQQDIQKTLSLILFAEKTNPNESIKQQLKQYKENLISILPPADVGFIQNQAMILADEVYPYFNP